MTLALVGPEIQKRTTRFYRVDKLPWLVIPPSIGWVLLDAHYTLVQPPVQVALPVSHDVPADFQERNSLSLTSPLSECLDRKSGDRGHIFSGQQRRGCHRRERSNGFCCARHQLAVLTRVGPITSTTTPHSFKRSISSRTLRLPANHRLLNMAACSSSKVMV